MDDRTLELIRLALTEDVASGDLTSAYFLTDANRSQGHIIAREAGILSGIEIAETAFREIDPGVGLWSRFSDGEAFAAGDTIIEIEGKTRSILTAERTALNFLQRLSAIATQTAVYVKAVQPYPTEVWDTRKTTPGWRTLEKAAVKAGGGVNHRMGLFDAVMVKDNHLAANGNLEALQHGIDALRRDHPKVRIQFEAATLEQLADFLSLKGLDMILLDNMTVEQLTRAVEINQGRLWLEASGGVTLQTIGAIAATGVNSISVGALTHSVKALDLALDLF